MRNLTKERLARMLAAVLETAGDEDEPMPLGPAYLALQSAMGCDLDEWTRLRGFMAKAGLATFTSETMTLTASGHQVVAQLRGENDLNRPPVSR